MKFFDNLKFIGISLLLAVGIAACDAPGPAETAGKNIDQTINNVGESMNEQSQKAGIAIDDTGVTARVKAAIFAEPGLDTLQINVVTVKGAVTLSGSVDSSAQSDRAEALASAMSGVSKVNNRLVVKSY